MHRSEPPLRWLARQCEPPGSPLLHPIDHRDADVAPHRSIVRWRVIHKHHRSETRPFGPKSPLCCVPSPGVYVKLFVGPHAWPILHFFDLGFLRWVVVRRGAILDGPEPFVGPMAEFLDLIGGQQHRYFRSGIAAVHLPVAVGVPGVRHIVVGSGGDPVRVGHKVGPPPPGLACGRHPLLIVRNQE